MNSLIQADKAILTSRALGRELFSNDRDGGKSWITAVSDSSLVDLTPW